MRQRFASLVGLVAFAAMVAACGGSNGAGVGGGDAAGAQDGAPQADTGGGTDSTAPSDGGGHEGGDAGPTDATTDGHGGSDAADASDASPLPDGGCSPVGALDCSGTQPVICTGGSWQPVGAPCTGTTPVCIKGACDACTPGSVQCNGQQPQTCDPSGAWQDLGAACQNQTCVTGACEGLCAPGQSMCAGNSVQSCGPGGQWGSPTPCTNQACLNGACTGVCTPGAVGCNGQQPQTCDVTGNWQPSGAACTASQSCDSQTGACVDDCAGIGGSYIGCEYYAVTMSNSALNQSTFTFAVALANPGTKAANVTITGPNATSITDTIAAGQLTEYTLGWVQPISCSGTCDGVTISPGTTALVTSGAYHIVSNEPIGAYQFNARNYILGSAYSYTNDASLLIPVNALTGSYRVMAGASFVSTSNLFPGNVDIVATSDGTQVTYTAPAGNPIQAAAGLTATGGTVTLNHGDVLHIAASTAAPVPDGGLTAFGSDQTGAFIAATQPVEVLGGADCTYIPADVGYCDHLEQSNLPLEALGSDYLVTVPNNLNATPQQYVKIVGTQDGTTLTYDPPQPGAATSLAAGQVTFFQSTQDFRVTSTQPVFIGQFMEGQDNFGTNCAGGTATDCGDPSMTVTLPTARFRTTYQFLAPGDYPENWVNVMAPIGASVNIDGKSVTGFVAIGTSGYAVAHVSLCTGTSCTGFHTANGSAPFGIQVYGYGTYTSYMYPGY